MIGTRLSHYLIEEKIGEGGMGVVYKAQDTRLFRHVAIKILPSNLVSIDKNRERLVQEARAASALNHPNICTVHDIGEANGIHFIVMEFIEGQTLREILEARGQLPEDEVIEIATKVCDALTAAHNKGIIHRDIKPDNIMITRDGGVKVMDFGLAKLLEGEDAQLQTATADSFILSKDLLKTSVSTFQGTATYMSPEQIEKRRIDGRTDVFSVGVLLYELLTGIPPFSGRDSVAVMKSILRDDPRPVTDMVPDISPEVDAAVLKALGKRPVERHDSASAFREVLQKSSSEYEKTDPRNTWHRFFDISMYSRKSWIAISTILLLALSLAFYFTKALNSSKNDRTAKSKTRTYPLVTSPYYENLPAISPDGNQVAYVSDESGNFDIWVKEVNGSAATNLTKSFDGLDTEPVWSPDGTEIVFRSERNGGGLFVKSLLTSQVRQISDFGEEPSWSSDNKLIAFVSRDVNMSGNEIWIMKMSDGAQERLFSPGHGYRCLDLSWTPDGNWLVFKLLHGGRKEIHAVSLITKKSVELLRGNVNYGNPVVALDMQSLYFLSDQGGVVDIWKANISLSPQNIRIIGALQNKTIGIGMVNFAITANGKKVVYTESPAIATGIGSGTGSGRGMNVVMALQSDPSLGFATRKKLDFGLSGTLDPEFSPDGKWIAFEGDLSGKYDIWISSVTGDSLRNITDDMNKNTGPSWSPDGQWLVYDSGGGNNAEIRMIPLRGGKPTQLTNNDWADWMPDWSPDGKSIIYSTNRTRNWDIWGIRLEDKKESQFTNSPGYDYGAQWSPDGKKIAFVSDRDGNANIWIMSADGADFRQITHFHEDGVGRTLGWDPGGMKIYFYRKIRKVHNIYACYLDTSKIDQLTFYSHERANVSDLGGLSVHENKIVFHGEGGIESDIWVMDNFDSNE